MILSMTKSKRIVEVDEFRTAYDYASGFRAVYAVLRNGETIELSRDFSGGVRHGYGYNCMPQLQAPNTDSEEDLDNKDIWTKIRTAVMKNKPVSLPI